MIRFACPACRAVLAVPEHAVGKKGPCPKCGQRVQIPAPSRNHTMLGISAPKKSADGSAPLVPPMEADWQHSPPIREQVVASRVFSSDTRSEQSPSFAPTAARRAWYRLASPTFLIGAIVLFFLPWVDIRCSAANGAKTIASQSGFQMIYGGYSLHPALESPAIDEAREMREKLGLESLSFAPLFAVYLVALLAAFCACSLRLGRFALAMSVIAFLILLGHVVIGLPAQNDIRNFYRAMAKQDKGGWGMLLDTHLTVWFWLAFLLLLGAIGILVSETNNRLGRWRTPFRNLDIPDESVPESVFPDPAEEGGRLQAVMDDAQAATSSNWIDTDHAPAKTPLGTKIAVIAVPVGALAVVAVAIALCIKVKEQDRQKNEIKANKGIGQGKGETIRVALTEDQLAAWRKVRKEHMDRPVRVLGCLPRIHGRQAFDDDWRAEDCWNFANQDRIFIEGSLAGQPAPPWAKGYDLGKAYFPSTFSVRFEDTDEFRNLEERKRKEDAKKKEDPFYPIIPNWFEDSVKWHADSWEEQKFPAALRYAEQFCQRKEVKATAVVDVFGSESPRILRWYWNDGNQTKSSEKPPNQQRLDSLKRFLQAVMRHADSID